MKSLLSILMALFISTGFLASSDAEAKRIGGGKSTGMKRDSSQFSKPAPAQQAAAPGNAASPTATPPKSGMSRWLGPLAGFGLGALFASMFGGSALMGALGNILMIALLIAAAFFIFNMIRRKQSASTMQYAGSQAGQSNTLHRSGFDSNSSSAAPAITPEVGNNQQYPEGFDLEGFLRQAKISFIRLQAANDAKDLRDIRDYTTPELYAELAMQMQERDGGVQKIEVMNLEAQMLEVIVEDNRAIASVRFTGLVREDDFNPPVSIDEVWHVTKELKVPGATWLVAGIQQVS
jgi:predicted lipid-binding transport protein (Tim44 family)